MQLRIRDLGRTNYPQVWDFMKQFTDRRDSETVDELWFTEHEPVYTLGQAGKLEHLLNPGKIPVISSDRGGQVTYHGPGQIVAYLLRDLRRQKEQVHDFVCNLEGCMIDTLTTYGISATRLEQNPGVYVENKKIGALGLRIRKGCVYHGLSLNVAMDLSPFRNINPCGLVDMDVTQMSEFVPDIDIRDVREELSTRVCTRYGYDDVLSYTRGTLYSLAV